MECLCMRSMHTALLSNICTTVQILHETIQQLPELWELQTPELPGNSNSKSRLNLKFLKIKNLEIIILELLGACWLGEIQNQRRRGTKNKN